MQVSDIKINSWVRGVLAKHWIDFQGLQFGSYQGTVRLSGELRYLGMRESFSTEALKLGLIENEIRGLSGVKRVHVDLANWRKNSRGEWEQRAVARSLAFSRCRRY